MSASSPSSPTCASSLKILADFWTLRIIEALSKNGQRYCELQRSIGNVNPATLTKKLAELETAGLVYRHEENSGHNVTYALTAIGKDTVPVLDAIRDFSKKFERATNKKSAT